MIDSILNHWHKTLKDSHRERRQLLGYRLEDAKKSLIPYVYEAPEINKTIYLGRCGEYFLRICNVWYECNCPAYLYSKSENKTPCKHLYALALWGKQQQGIKETT